MAQKRKLFHTLNERSREQLRREEERQKEMWEGQINDPRRYDSFERISPLIKDDE